MVRWVLVLAAVGVASQVYRWLVEERRAREVLAGPIEPWPAIVTEPDPPAQPSSPRSDPPAQPDPPRSDPPAAWLPPADGACPPGHPVKVKLRSRLYHLPGMSAYERTGPDRCYASAEAAEADGFARAKR